MDMDWEVLERHEIGEYRSKNPLGINKGSVTKLRFTPGEESVRDVLVSIVLSAYDNSLHGRAQTVERAVTGDYKPLNPEDVLKLLDYEEGNRSSSGDPGGEMNGRIPKGIHLEELNGRPLRLHIWASKEAEGSFDMSTGQLVAEVTDTTTLHIDMMKYLPIVKEKLN